MKEIIVAGMMLLTAALGYVGGEYDEDECATSEVTE